MKIAFSKINLLKLFNLERVEKGSIFVISAAIFILTNFLINYLPLRIDFSLGKAYTLSPSTKKIISKLDDVVNIKFFISSDLPTRLLSLKTETIDLLNEYKKDGKGKIIVKILDPKKDSDSLNEATELGIPQLQFSQLEKDKYSIANTFFGMAISYEDKREIIPQATNLSSLEYDLTSLIYKMTRKENPKVGIIGTSEIGSQKDDDLYTIKKILKQQYDLDFLNLFSEKNKTIDSSIKTLVVFDDGRQYATDEANVIRNYLNRQGQAIFLFDGVYIDDGLTISPANHDLFSLFDSYGISLNRDLILSGSSEMANFSTGMISFFTPYPFWVKTSNFYEKTPEFSNVGALVFPWVSSLAVAKKNEITIKPLVKSEKNSWEQKENFILDPNNIPLPKKEDLKEFSVVVEVSIKNKGKFVLIPSSRFVKEQFLSRGGGNLEFLVNLVNNYASQGVLSGIRNRSFSAYPLRPIDESKKDLVKYLNILLLPGLLSIVGTIRLMKRK